MVPARAARYGSPSRLLAQVLVWLRAWLRVWLLVWLLAQVLSANPKFGGHGKMPYVAQNGVCCGFRANFVAEATIIANSSCRCHISVASEFRVGDLYQESPLPTSDPAPAVPAPAIKLVKADSLPGTGTGSANPSNQEWGLLWPPRQFCRGGHHNR